MRKRIFSVALEFNKIRRALLFASAVAFVCCMLALGVSARTVYYEGQNIDVIEDIGDPSWYTGNVALAIQDKSSVVILQDADGSMTAYPSYCLFNYSVSMVAGQVDYAEIRATDYSHINNKTGKSYGSGSLYYAEIPYGTTRMGPIFPGTSKEENVVEYVLPDTVVEIGSKTFVRMTSCRRINIPKNLVSIPKECFAFSQALTEVVIPYDCKVVSIEEDAFLYCENLEILDLEKCRELEKIGDSAFERCRSLRTICLPESLVEIGNRAFYRMENLLLASDYLPKNLTTIGTHFLSGCTLGNETLYFPEGLTSFDATYHFNDGFRCGKLTLVFLGKMTSVNLENMRLLSAQGGLTVVFAKNAFSELDGDFVQGVDWKTGKRGYISERGDGSQAYAVKTGGGLSVKLPNQDPNTLSVLGTDADGNTILEVNKDFATVVFCGGDTVECCYTVRNYATQDEWYRYFTTAWEHDMDEHAENGEHYLAREIEREANCGYDGLATTTCVVCKEVNSAVIPATQKHSYENDFDCSTDDVCDVCLLVVNEAQEHFLQWCVYSEGFSRPWTILSSCEKDNCHYETAEERAPLVDCFGYSTKEFGGCVAILQGFRINHESVAEYEAWSGEPLEIGTVVYVNGRDQEISPVEEYRAVILDISNVRSNYVEVWLLGIPEDFYDMRAVLCLYVRSEEWVCYIDNGKETAAVVGISYNEIMEMSRT